jgi:hypothetical protein
MRYHWEALFGLVITVPGQELKKSLDTHFQDLELFPDEGLMHASVQSFK